LLRKIRIGEHYFERQKFLEWLQDTHPGSEEAIRDFALEAPPNHKRNTTRRGRKPIPDRALLQVAKNYAKKICRRSRRPIADVARQKSMTKEKVRAMIHQARKRGLLTGTPGQGRIGGQLTEKAHRLMGRK
jgi:hypothetical protein